MYLRFKRFFKCKESFTTTSTEFWKNWEKTFSHGNQYNNYLNLILLAFKIELHHASSILLSTISHYSEYLSGQQWAKWKGEGLGIDMHCRCQLVDQKKKTRIALENYWSWNLRSTVLTLPEIMNNWYILLVHFQVRKKNQCDHFFLKKDYKLKVSGKQKFFLPWRSAK